MNKEKKQIIRQTDTQTKLNKQAQTERQRDRNRGGARKKRTQLLHKKTTQHISFTRKQKRNKKII